MDENITNMEFQEQEVQSRETMISEKYYPGFSCFFKSYLQQNSITFSECFEPMLHSNEQINQVKNPLQNILKYQNMNYATKERELMRRSYGNRLHLHFYKSNQNKKYSLDFYTNQEKEKKLKDLQDKLDSLRTEKERLIVEKKEYFRIQREKQIERQRIQEQKKAQRVEMKEIQKK